MFKPVEIAVALCLIVLGCVAIYGSVKRNDEMVDARLACAGGSLEEYKACLDDLEGSGEQ
jgi:hypothetical protein